MKTYHDIATDGGSDVLGQVTEQQRQLQERLSTVRHVVAVMSGKGGVGKSTLTVNLAAALADGGAAVGIVDADLNGPSIAHMMGVRGQRLLTEMDGVVPAVGACGISVMSMDLLLADAGDPVLWDATTQKDAYTWRGTMEAVALRELVADTAWGSLDYLLLDLPPGADRLPNAVDVCPRIGGAVVVTIPSAVSHAVVARSVRMAHTLLETPLVGVVENMGAYVCPHCGQEEALFPRPAVDVDLDVPLLATIPFDPRMARAGDEGMPFYQRHPDAPAGHAIRALATRISQSLDARHAPAGGDGAP